MTKKSENPEDDLEFGTSRRFRRVAFWAALTLGCLALAAFAHSAISGTKCVRGHVVAETAAAYLDLKTRAPGAVDPVFGRPTFESCHAIFPGLIRCTYRVVYGPRAGGAFESVYFWNGSACKRLSHEMPTVY